MQGIFIFCILIILVSSLVLLLSLSLSYKIKTDREKSSSFECGFDSNSMNRVPFSVRFFLLTILFLIFDVEIVILLPSVLNLIFINFIYWWSTMSIFLVILLLGLFHEYRQGALDWSL